jgi:hypothetical protein
MKQKTHREKFMFDCVTINDKLVVCFERLKHGKYSRCGKTTDSGSTLFDNCFKRDKRLVRKNYC